MINILLPCVEHIYYIKFVNTVILNQSCITVENCFIYYNGNLIFNDYLIGSRHLNKYRMKHIVLNGYKVNSSGYFLDFPLDLGKFE